MFDIFFALFGFTYMMGRGINKGANQMLLRQYEESMGYDLNRQGEIEHMVYSTDPSVRKKFDRMVGRTVNRKNEFDTKLAVMEVSIREGWGYFDICEAYSDPVYVKLTGGKWDRNRTPGQYYGKPLMGREKALEMIAETDKRAAWIRSCPHGDEVDIFPMDFESEEKYREAVENTFYQWRYSCIGNDFCIKPSDFETEALYEEEVRKKREYYEQFRVYKNESSDFCRLMSIHHINTIIEKWYEYSHSTDNPVEIANAVYNWIVDFDYQTSDYLSILEDKCAIENVDWFEFLRYRTDIDTDKDATEFS